MRLARAIADRADASDEQVVQAARDVRRYFVEALPLHVADEDDSIAPRLRGRDRSLDEALSVVTAEHAAMNALLDELTSRCASIASAPGDCDRVGLRACIDALDRHWDEHLALEERLVIPAAKTLEPAIVAAIRDEMTARRTR